MHGVNTYVKNRRRQAASACPLPAWAWAWPRGQEKATGALHCQQQPSHKKHAQCILSSFRLAWCDLPRSRTPSGAGRRLPSCPACSCWEPSIKDRQYKSADERMVSQTAWNRGMVVVVSEPSLAAGEIWRIRWSLQAWMPCQSAQDKRKFHKLMYYSRLFFDKK